MSGRLKILAVLNVVGWLVAVPLLLSALVGPIVGFSDWPGAPGAGSQPVPEVQLGDPPADQGAVRSERDSGSSPDRDGTRRSREALDRALLRRTLDGLPGAGDEPGATRVPAPGAGAPDRPASDGGRPGGVRDLGPAPPLSPDPPSGRPAPDPPDPVPAPDGAPIPGGGGGPAPTPTPAPAAGPDVPAPAPSGGRPAGGDPATGGGTRASGQVRPGGGLFNEAQTPDHPEAAPEPEGQAAVAAPEPPAPPAEPVEAVEPAPAPGARGRRDARRRPVEPQAPDAPGGPVEEQQAPAAPLPDPVAPEDVPDEDHDHDEPAPEPPPVTRPQDDLEPAPTVEDCPPPGGA